MSNPSLKEQLTALSLGGSSATEEPDRKDKKKTKPRPHTHSQPQHQSKAEKPGKQKPVWLEHAQYGVELLKAHFPNCFKDLKEIHPLKIGIKQDLVKHLGSREDIVLGDKACMVNSLAYYVNSVAYHKSMTEGAARIDLEGNSVSSVSAEESIYSSECRKAKLQKKQTPNTNVRNSQEQEVTPG
ncbi:MAG: ProQ/FinO family protein [Gammaproteobacteria bacterium]